MPGHDLIVIGASAGGVEAVSMLLAGLPPDLPAAVCVVVHLRPYQESRLAEVFSRCSTLSVVSARNGLALEPGTICVAVPDEHLLVERAGDHGVVRLVHGPRENRARPAIDPLFRSAALAFGPRAIGVVLSGALDDGTAGLWAIRDAGGIVVVQDPADAAVPSMPANAIAEVGADHMAGARDLGSLLGRLAREPVPGDADATVTDGTALEVAIVTLDEQAHAEPARTGVPTRHVCPDCGGVLWDVSRTEGGPLRFRCETGHAYSPATLAEEQVVHVEASLWAALRALDDRAELSRVRAHSARERGLAAMAEQFGAQEQAAQQHAAALRALLRLDGRAGIRPKAHDERPSSGSAPHAAAPPSVAPPRDMTH